ncbi:helix-turn-helix domain-containing protein [Streptomyces sp. NPDC052040]|uniref:helix-turn-helix domain-containing protein n=1 Tax=Streptomyces sp. NPDC052040 TaxID=3365682 RepID=UPI0037D5FE69
MSRAPASAGLEGKALAARLGWQTSKVSRLQNGRQPPPPAAISPRGCPPSTDWTSRPNCTDCWLARP